jgi:hypothetical protein
MALSADQRAMLELLLGRGQSYEDLSSLLGSPADEVRSKARWALAELGGADPDRNVGLTDYLLGQADPIGRADAVRHLRDDAADRELAERLETALREIAPDAELPSLPTEGRTAPHLRAPSLPGRPAKERTPKTREPMDPRRARLLMVLGGAGVVLIIVVLAITGAFSGGSDNGGVDTITNASNTTGSTTTTPTQADPNSVPVPLKGVGGSPGSGLATLQLSNQTLSLDLRVSNLPPPPSGSVYVVWLRLGAKGHQGYPIAPLTPYPQSGSFHQAFPLPQAINPFLTQLTSIEVTVLSQKSATALAKEIANLVKNPKQGKLIFPIQDQTVLRATVPRGKAAPSGSGSGSGQGASGSGQ